MVQPMRSRLRDLWLLLTQPAAWSAEHYRRKNRMDYTALHPNRWGQR